MIMLNQPATAATRRVSLPVRSANRVAEKITGRPYVSWSQLSCMRQCPQKFAFQYVLNTPPDHQPSSLLFGGAVHSALELHFRSYMEGMTVTVAALFSAYRDSWQNERRHPDLPVRFNKGEDEASLDALAGRIFEAFLASPESRPAGTLVGVEEELTVTLDPDLPDVLARVDLVIQDEQALHVIDFKTSRSRWNEQKAAESAEQLMLYANTVGRLARELALPVQAGFVVITKAKKPAVQSLGIDVDPSRLTGAIAAIKPVWQAVLAGHFYPSPHPMHCTTCQFRSRCPVFGGRPAR